MIGKVPNPVYRNGHLMLVTGSNNWWNAPMHPILTICKVNQVRFIDKTPLVHNAMHVLAVIMRSDSVACIQDSVRSKARTWSNGGSRSN